MGKAGQTMGFAPDVCDQAVRQTLLGAATLLSRSKDPPAQLRAAVTSKAGTTAAAATVLDEAGVMDTFVRALVAARDRGAQLSR